MSIPQTTFSESDIRSLEPAMKIGILGTVTPEGLPHLTMISTLKACSLKRICFGQFIEGRSKQHLRENPKAGWLIMTLDRSLWRGAARFSHTVNSGPDFDFYNNTPLFRYNAYFGIHTVYYLDLLFHTGKSPLPMNAVVFATLRTMLARSLAKSQPASHKTQPAPQPINPWTQSFLNRLNTLKFIGYLNKNGYPQIIPAIQAQAAGPEQIVFAASPYQEELADIPAGAPLAVFGLSLEMEDVLLRGRFNGLQRIGGQHCGSVTIDWAYNAMPPVPGQIYPPLPLETVTEF